MWLSQAKSKRKYDGDGVGETLHVAESRVLSKVPISPLSDDLGGATVGRWSGRGGEGIKGFRSESYKQGAEGGRPFRNQHDGAMAMSACKPPCVGQQQHSRFAYRTSLTASSHFCSASARGTSSMV
jgi:hypothetical protein